MTITKVHGYNFLALSNMSIVFLPPNVTSVVQSLNQGIIASFKVQKVDRMMSTLGCAKCKASSFMVLLGVGEDGGTNYLELLESLWNSFLLLEYRFGYGR